jgi:hypothetical protein
MEAPFISAIQDLVAHAAGWILVGQFQGVVAVPLNIDDGDECLGKDAPDSDIGLEIFEFHEPDLPIVGAVYDNAGLIADAINVAFGLAACGIFGISLSAGSAPAIWHFVESPL